MVNTMEHEFSLEMKSKKYISNLSISDKAYDRVLFEGNLGESKLVHLEEGNILELCGEHGILRISFTMEQLQDVVHRYQKSTLRGEKN